MVLVKVHFVATTYAIVEFLEVCLVQVLKAVFSYCVFLKLQVGYFYAAGVLFFNLFPCTDQTDCKQCPHPLWKL